MNHIRTGALAHASVMLLAGASLLLPALGRAQEATGLRSAVTEPLIAGRLPASTEATPLRQPRRSAITTYVPFSDGALPVLAVQPQDVDNLQADPLADPFADEPLARRAARPSTARDRAGADSGRTGSGRAAAEGEAARAGAEPIGAISRSDQTTGEATTDEQAGSTLRARPIGAEIDDSLDLGSERATPIQPLTRRIEDDPYAPLGLRLGTFTVRTSLEQGLTATSNATSSAGGGSAVLSESALRLNAVSDWSTHEARVDAYGIFRKSVSGEEIEETEAGISASLRLDVTRDLKATGSLAYEREPESAASPSAVEGTLSQPIRQRLSASAGLEKDVGKLRFGVLGSVQHDAYGEAELSGGGTVSQADRDSTLATVALRGGYELSPALTPFVEVEVGRRFYDQEEDTEGYRRSADRLGVRGGLELDLSEKVTGEFSAGWLRESFDDDRLEAISGAALDGSLAWSPERGTTVGLAARTEVEGATSAGESGSILYSTRATLDRQMRANLTANALLGAAWRDYTGSSDYDLTLAAEAGLTWWLNRYAGVTGRVRHEQVESNRPDRESQTNSVFLGLKLQR